LFSEDRSAKAKITLWEDYGEGFYPYLFPPESGPYIVIVTATTVKEFRGKYYYKAYQLSAVLTSLGQRDV